MNKREGSFLGFLRVLDLTDEKGMLCGKLLGDLGADVIKIEPPRGSPARNIAPFYHDIPDPQKSLFWFACNANKRSITLDIETADGHKLFAGLAEKADIIVESFPPGLMEKLGLGYAALSETNPGLVVTSITPFGQTGQYKDYEACDLTIQAMSCYATGDPDRSPVRWGGEQSLALPGWAAAAATVIAVYQRGVSGKGQQVDVSMRETMIWGAQGALRSLFWEFQREVPQREGNVSRRGATVVRSIFPCQDGRISWRIWPGTMGRLTRRVVDWMDSLGKAGGLKDIEWSWINVLTTKQEDWDRWEQAFAEFFMGFSKREIYEAAGKWGFLAVPVAGPKDILENPQLASRGYFIPVEHTDLGESIIYPGKWFRSNEVEMAVNRAPLMGEHNEEVYVNEMGLSKNDLTMLKEAGAI